MKQKRMLKVEDLMTTAVLSMKESDTLSAAQLEMKMAEIRHLPVVDAKSHVVGVISDRDVLRVLTKIDGKPIPVTQIMSRRVRTATASMPAHEAAALMLENKIGCLPVVNDEQVLVGIVTETDFLKIAEQALLGVDVTRRPS